MFAREMEGFCDYHITLHHCSSLCGNGLEKKGKDPQVESNWEDKKEVQGYWVRDWGCGVVLLGANLLTKPRTPASLGPPAQCYSLP